LCSLNGSDNDDADRRHLEEPEPFNEELREYAYKRG